MIILMYVRAHWAFVPLENLQAVYWKPDDVINKLGC